MDDPDHCGVAVGCLLMSPRQAQRVVRALDAMAWKKPGCRVTPHGDRLAIAVTPEAARALDAHHAAADKLSNLPPDLDELLAEGMCSWCSAMRAGLAASIANRGNARGAHIKPPGSQLPAHGANGVSAGNTHEAPSSTFRYVELFAGIGGFRVALDALGGKCCLASEIDAAAAATYETNFGEQAAGDITDVSNAELPEHDLLTAGFPCQSFSRSGQQLGLSSSGGNLFHEIIRVARARKPAALLLENVPNLLRVDNGHAMHTIVQALTSAGYCVRVQLLNAGAVVPQARERVFFACFRDATAASAFRWPTFPSRRPIGRRVLSDVLQTLTPRELCTYRLSQSQWRSVQASPSYVCEPQWRLSQLDGEARTLRSSYRTGYLRFSEFVPGVSAGGDAINAAVNAAAAARAGTVAEAIEAVQATEAVVQATEAVVQATEAVVLSALDDSETSLGGAGSPPPRFYTERECARIVGFPDSYILAGGKVYHQLGNAVCPPLVHAVAKQMLAAMGIRAHDAEEVMAEKASEEVVAEGEAAAAVVAEGEVAEEVAAEEAAAEEAVAEDEGSCECESFLTTSSVSVLRSVCAPHNHMEVEARCKEAWPSDYASYRAESAPERLQKVLTRSQDSLFCRECHETYHLSPIDAQPNFHIAPRWHTVGMD